jgi:hypothetical protein
MPQDLPTTLPTAFGLESFSDLLPVRDPIPGEDPGSFEGFRAAMMASLIPGTPYECVIAENLIAIEWELVQHRRMRDSGLRVLIRKAIRQAIVRQKDAEHQSALEASWERHVEAGGSEANWNERPSTATPPRWQVSTSRRAQCRETPRRRRAPTRT